MILSSYRFGSLLKEEYQKLETYARKAEDMYCGIFMPGSAVCACGKNLLVQASMFLERSIIDVGVPSGQFEVQVRADKRSHPPVDEPHLNTSAMFTGESYDAFKDSDFHSLKLKKYGFIESEK